MKHNQMQQQRGVTKYLVEHKQQVRLYQIEWIKSNGKWQKYILYKNSHLGCKNIIKTQEMITTEFIIMFLDSGKGNILQEGQQKAFKR